MKKIFIPLIVILAFAVTVFAITFPQDNNGVPYNYPVLTGGSSPGTFMDTRIMDSTGASGLYTPTANGNYYLGVFSLLTGINGGFPQRINSFNISGSELLGTRSFTNDGSGNAIGSTYVGGPHCLDVVGALGQPYTNNWISMSTCDTTGIAVASGGNYNYALAVKNHDKDGHALTSYSTGPGTYVNQSVVVGSGGAIISWTPSSLGWVGIGGYPSSAENVFENSETKPIIADTIEAFTSKTALVTTDAGGSYSDTAFVDPSPGKKVSVKSISWTTPSNSASGTVVLDFATSVKYVEYGFVTNANKDNTGDLHVEGAIDENLRLVITSGGNAQNYFVVVTYREE